MRIAIITQPLRYNYGGIVQNFALQTVLRRMGHSVVTLDGEVKERKSIKNNIIKVFRKIIRLLSNKKGNIFGIWKYQSTTEKLSKNTKKFIDSYINVRRLDSLKKNEFDIFVVGSDQVWRPSYSNLNEAYLEFASGWSNIKRISYAASFGTDKWEYTDEETIYCRELIKRFDAVSVREESAVKLCKEFLGVKAIHVLDPTMLLDKQDYIKEINLDKVPKSPGTLFFYFLDGNNYKNSIVTKIEQEKGVKSFTVNSKVEQSTANFDDRIQPPVEAWLRAFYDADYVVTDSFHGCVFSMIFEKPFVVLSNPKRGSARFESLLKMFGQQNRLLLEGTEVSDISFLDEKPIVDFDQMRKLSIGFLTEAIERKPDTQFS